MMSMWFFALLKVCNETIKISKHPILKDEQITLYCHFIKIIKDPRTSF